MSLIVSPYYDLLHQDGLDQGSIFSFSKGVSVYRIKKYIDRCFSETFGSVTELFFLS